MRFVEAKQQLQVHDGVNILTVVATGVLKVLQILNQSRNSNTSIDQRHPETVFIFKLSQGQQTAARHGKDGDREDDKKIRSFMV